MHLHQLLHKLLTGEFSPIPSSYLLLLSHFSTKHSHHANGAFSGQHFSAGAELSVGKIH